MADLDKAVATQLANIEKRTGKSNDELAAELLGCVRTAYDSAG